MLRIEVAERGVQQVQPFADAAPRQPQRLQRGRELQGEPGIAVLAAPRKRGAQVVDLELDLGQTAPVVSPPRGVEHRGHRRVVVAVTCTHGISLAGLLQFFGAVLAHRVQQPVTRRAAATVGHHQRLVDEQAELIEDLEMFDVTARGDRPRGVEVEATHKHRQPAKQHPLGVGQQRMRPVHRGAQGLLAAHRGARTAGQQPEPVMQAVEDLGQRQRAHPRRRQLDRQRQTIQARADLGHRGGVVAADGEIRPGMPRPVDEQLDGFIGQRQRRHPPTQLTRHPDGLTTRRQQGQPRRCTQDGHD